MADLSPPEDAHVSITDRGLLLGDGVFETMAVYNGRVFDHDAHLERLASGLGVLGFARSGRYFQAARRHHALCCRRSRGLRYFAPDRDARQWTARPRAATGTAPVDFHDPVAHAADPRKAPHRCISQPGHGATNTPLYRASRPSPISTICWRYPRLARMARTRL